MSTITIDGKPATVEEWLAARKSGIGASEAAAVLGVSPYRNDTELSVYLRKLGLLPEVEESEAMRWGTKLEPLVAAAYVERTGCEFAAEQFFLRHPEHGHMIATLDRVTTAGKVVELKTIGARGAGMLGLDGTDETPWSWIVQVHHQLIVHGSDEADIAALVGGQEMRYFTVRRDDRLADLIVRKEAEFWRRVEERRPPEPEPGRDGRLLAYLYPEPSGEIDATPAMEALAAAWEDLGAELREKGDERDGLRDELLRAMEDAETAVLPDGRRLKRSVVGGKPERTVVMRATEPYQTLRILKAKENR